MKTPSEARTALDEARRRLTEAEATVEQLVGEAARTDPDAPTFADVVHAREVARERVVAWTARVAAAEEEFEVVIQVERGAANSRAAAELAAFDREIAVLETDLNAISLQAHADLTDRLVRLDAALAHAERLASQLDPKYVPGCRTAPGWARIPHSQVMEAAAKYIDRHKATHAASPPTPSAPRRERDPSAALALARETPNLGHRNGPMPNVVHSGRNR